MDTSQLGAQQEINTWLKDKALKKIADNLNIPCQNFTYKLTLPENCHFLSSVWFLDIKYSETNNVSDKTDEKNHTFHLVIKKPAFNDALADVMHTDALFHNEILFFETIAGGSEDFPRCLLTIENKKDQSNSIIVMENIGYRGYEICPKSYDIPFEYTISAMQAIGRFHGMGYVMKTRKPKEFFDVVDNIQESRYIPGDKFNQFVNLIATRPVEWMRKHNYDPHFIDIMEKHLSDAFTNVQVDAIRPIEPLAVLCHGDFTRNNVFFRKTETGISSMLIDFAMLRYSSPAIDTSTFLYLNVSRTDRNERFNEIFTAYHDALINYLQEHGIKDLEKYSYSKLLDDYKQRALFGFVIAEFFLPIVRGMSAVTQDDLAEWDIELWANKTRTLGGDAFSQELADILEDLWNQGCLDHILNN
ncbi:uncharacterized protein [Chelonus insularis]|uniref:uncharacterized protein n=1 Tax=Chelonus insularis TaxID=460826 RepID=UPI00158CF958|nr:uncharacterized protein LOC118069694 [Chelonus insularis]